MHYLSVIHCLAIILLVYFFLPAFVARLCPWLSESHENEEAKIKIGEYHIFYIVCVREHYTKKYLSAN